MYLSKLSLIETIAQYERIVCLPAGFKKNVTLLWFVKVHIMSFVQECFIFLFEYA